MDFNIEELDSNDKVVKKNSPIKKNTKKPTVKQSTKRNSPIANKTTHVDNDNKINKLKMIEKPEVQSLNKENIPMKKISLKSPLKKNVKSMTLKSKSIEKLSPEKQIKKDNPTKKNLKIKNVNKSKEYSEKEDYISDEDKDEEEDKEDEENTSTIGGINGNFLALIGIAGIAYNIFSSSDIKL